MRRRTNLKAVEEKPEQMTWEQIDRLARSLAIDLMDNEHPEIIHTLLLLMHEIGAHSFDQGHVGTVTILMRDHLFAITTESDRAEEQLIAKLREKFQKGGEGR
jgi:hypothetical protein